MYEEVKEEIKICEGYVNKIYKCSEGFDTIFYGHKVIPGDSYQIGEGGVSKFKNMWKALDSEDYGEASFQMLDSKWAKQTPARAGKLAGKMKAAKL